MNQEIKLLPLPVVCYTMAGGLKLYDEKDMHNYATAAVLADRAERKPIPVEQFSTNAYKASSSRYSRRSEPYCIGYSFLPHGLEQFVRAIEAYHGIKEQA